MIKASTRIWLGGILILFSAWAPSAFAQASNNAATGPSFACVPTSGVVEQAICASPELSTADRTMATLFALVRVSAFGRGASNELAAQRDSLKAMRGCAKPDAGETVATCLRGRYAQRNNDLAIAALIQAPDTALPVLRRTDPGFAPVLEAVAIWVGEPVDADWSSPDRASKRKRIISLLAPYMTDFLTKEDHSYGQGILAAPGSDGVAVRHIEDIFGSERHFSAFLNVLGPYLPDDGAGARRSLPCTAVHRHPALLAATGSVFGSTLDNFVFETDCAETLPAIPKLAALEAKLNAAWPPCEGTIRFAAYRTYWSTIEAARLGLSPHDPKARIEHRRGVTTTDIENARAQLVTYYGTNLGKSRTDASVMATDAITAIMAAAQECE